MYRGKHCNISRGNLQPLYLNHVLMLTFHTGGTKQQVARQQLEVQPLLKYSQEYDKLSYTAL